MFSVAEQFQQQVATNPALAPVTVDGPMPPARFNIGPTQAVVALARGDEAPAPGANTTHAAPGVNTTHAAPGTIAAAVRWGLVPHWAKSMPKTPYFNARAETWQEKPVFRAARPCVIPMNGWYEWKDKQPYLVTLSPDSNSAQNSGSAPDSDSAQNSNSAPGDPHLAPLFYVAGLWARCGDLVSCTIVTTDAVGHLANLHHRMPRVLHDEELAGWLDFSDWAAGGEVGLTDPALVAALGVAPANKAVGNIANDGSWLLTP